MSTFKKYLTETYREYPIRIKLARPITDCMYECLEKFLKKYRVIEIGEVKKTIHQAHPLDFGDLENAEVYLIDVVLGLPASSYVLQQELTYLWEVPQKLLVVRNEYEGMEQSSFKIRSEDEIAAMADEKDLTRASLLSTNPNYMDHETAVPQELAGGDIYTDNFKAYLAKVASGRKDEVYPTNAGLFKFLMDNPQEHPNGYSKENDFNADVKGAPKIHAKWDAKDTETDEEVASDEIRSNWGNFWTTKTNSKPYKDYVDELEVALTLPSLTKVRKKYAKKD